MVVLCGRGMEGSIGIVVTFAISGALVCNYGCTAIAVVIILFYFGNTTKIYC